MRAVQGPGLDSDRRRGHLLASIWDRFDVYERALVGLLAAALVLRGIVLTLPIDQLLQRFLVDDAFYYLALVENALDGKGIVFNTGVPTNGFHPLWALVLTPLVAVLEPLGRNAPVRGTLALLTVINLATAVLMYRIGRRLEHPAAGLLAAAVWLLSPFLFRLNLLGLEAPLQVLLVALLVDRWIQAPEMARLAPRRAAGVGVLLGLVFLARMDGVFVVAAFGLVVLARPLQALRETGLGPKVQGTVAGLAAAAAGTLAVVVPWLAWSLIRVDRLLPVSGAALRALRTDALAVHELVPRALQFLAQGLIDVVFAPPIVAVGLLVALVVYVVPVLAGLVPAEGGLGAVRASTVGTLVGLGGRRRPLVELLDEVGFLVLAAALQMGYVAFRLHAVRPWYLVLPAFVVVLVGSILLVRLARRFSVGPRACTAALGALGILLASGIPFVLVPGQGPQEELKQAAVADVDEQIPEDARLGSFNTGVYQYYTPDRDVVNLDGVMNPQAFEARQEDRLEAYIQDQGIDYVLDPNRSADLLREDGVQLEIVETYTATWPHVKEDVWRPSLETKTQTYHLYRVIEATQASTAP